MPVLPTKIEDLIAFGEAHSAQWSANAAQIGLTPEAAAAIKAAIGTARTRFNAANVARGAAKSATLTQNQAVGTMKTLMADAIKQIRLYAETTNNTNVYALADIPAPAQPTPAPRPAQPSNMSAEIIPGGTLRVIFKAVNPSGGGPVTYIVSRKLENETAFRQIGTTGTSRPVEGLPRGFKAFVDSTLPSGANNFQYQIVGQRGDTFGEPSKIFTVVIGSGSGGGLNTQTGTLKMAA